MKHSAALAWIVACVALTVLLVAAWFAFDDARTDGSSPDLAPELRELARSQARMADALERLEGLLAARLEAPAGDRVAIDPRSGPAPESLDALVASLDALRESLGAESRRSQEMLLGAHAFGGESLAEIKRRNATPDWLALETLEESWRTDGEIANRSQHLIDVRNLVQAYGQPSTIYCPKNGVLFVYRRHAEGEAGPASFFLLKDGFVVEYWVEDEVQETAGG